MKSLLVRARLKTYPLYIGGGAVRQLPDLLQKLRPVDKLFLLTDENVARHYAGAVQEQLQRSSIPSKTLLVAAGETAKSLAVCEHLYTELIEAGASRDSAILALGGGVVGDLAGFAAATYMRGLRWAQIATTVIAQTDSSIGGKVGVNHPLGKNLIGAFHHPEWVVIDPAHLTTLPAREVRAGMAEVIKYAVIADRRLFDLLEKKLESLVELADMDLLTQVLRACCRIKADVVQQDEVEKGIRMHLNFGHTMGHALEAATGYQLLRHGEAVVLGMAVATRLSVLLNMLTAAQEERLLRLLRRLYPDWPDEVDRDRVLSHLTHDKKRGHRGQTWILLKKIGTAVICQKVPRELVEKALESILKGGRS